ncbi:MAG TPA: Gfo/Idh/MocA family oxidoreductase [Terrimicrobiaceae bacterium]|nr:Gfo/Idh/MocA family oxidoreductase [Terrimicrobiaceae bacterium]
MTNPEPSSPPLSRRSFLAASSALGAGLMLGLPRTVRAQSPESVDLPIALIGAGAQGRLLLDALVNIPGVRVQAVCDIWKFSQTQAQAKLRKAGQQPAVYENFEDLLATEKGLAAAVIATPDFCHAPQTIACLRAGLHVYCESMMSHTADGARAMVRAMRETGRLLQIGHQRRSNPRYIHVVDKLVRESRLAGRVIAAAAQWNKPVPDDLGAPKSQEIPIETLRRHGYQDMHQFRNWRWFRALSGGPIQNLGVHQVDVFNWIFDARPRALVAMGGMDYRPGREHFDNVMAALEFETKDGVARAAYEVVTTSNSGGGDFETFMGDQGTIVTSENQKLAKIYREARAADWAPLVDKGWLQEIAYAKAKRAAPGSEVQESARVAVEFAVPIILRKPVSQPHLENFFAAVRGTEKLNSDGAQAFVSELPVFKIHDAIAGGGRIALTPQDFAV